MIVVMAVTASEAEVLGVKSAILAEGLAPFDHFGSERSVIAVVGDAPCQCFSPGGIHNTSPGLISSTGPPRIAPPNRC